MQVLRAVVNSGSVTAAARNLGYTPSAVSQQVAALEKEAGAPLLERVGRGVRATAAGRLLTAHASLIGETVAEAEAALADLRAGLTGRLDVRYFATAGAALVAPAVTRFRAGHPDVRVGLRLEDPAESVPGVVAGEADLAIVVRARGETVRGVRLVQLLDDPYSAVLPAGHPLAARAELSLAELAEEPLVRADRPGGACERIVRDACWEAGFDPRYVVDSEDYATAQGFVAAGLGVALLPRTGLATRHPGVVVREFGHRGHGPVRPVCVALPEAASPARAEPGVLEALLDAFREVAGSLGAREAAGAESGGIA